jgi:predicted phosphodiesterase
MLKKIKIILIVFLIIIILYGIFIIARRGLDSKNSEKINISYNDTSHKLYIGIKNLSIIGPTGLDIIVTNSGKNQTFNYKKQKNQSNIIVIEGIDKKPDSVKVTQNTILDIWVFSDTHFKDDVYTYHNWNWSRIFRERLDEMKGKYDLGFFLGDIVEDSNCVNEFKETIDIINEKKLDEKLFIILGNHETLQSDSNNFIPDYYKAKLSRVNDHNYTYEMGNMLFIFLSEDRKEGMSFSMYAWFNKTVAENQDKIVIVATHRHPQVAYFWDYSLPYSDLFNKTLNQYHIDIWMYGHTHIQEVKEMNFDSGKTLFINSGHNKCNLLGCGYLKNREKPDYDKYHKSILLHTENSSNRILLEEIRYDPLISNVTPTISPLGNFILRKNINFYK